MSGCHSPYVMGNTAFTSYGCQCSCHSKSLRLISDCWCRCNSIDVKPTRNLADDILMQKEKTLVEQLKEMEARLKRHMTECKRDIIKEIETIFDEFKLKSPSKKEVKNVK